MSSQFCECSVLQRRQGWARKSASDRLQKRKLGSRGDRKQVSSVCRSGEHVQSRGKADLNVLTDCESVLILAGWARRMGRPRHAVGLGMSISPPVLVHRHDDHRPNFTLRGAQPVLTLDLLRSLTKGKKNERGALTAVRIDSCRPRICWRIPSTEDARSQPGRRETGSPGLSRRASCTCGCTHIFGADDEASGNME